MARRLLTLSWLGITLAACQAQIQASTVHDFPPLELSPADDPVQQIQAQSTVEGLVLSFTVEGSSVKLDSATLARIPRPVDASLREQIDAQNRVRVLGFAKGQPVSEVSESGSAINVEEGNGIIVLERRQVILVLAAPRPLDTVEIAVPAIRDNTRFDVRAAYAPYCSGDDFDSTRCPSPSAD